MNIKNFILKTRIFSKFPTPESIVADCGFTDKPDLKGLVIKGSGEGCSLIKAIPEPNGISSADADKKYLASSPTDTADVLRWYKENKRNGYFVVLGIQCRINGVLHVLVLYRSGSDCELDWYEWDGGWDGDFQFLSAPQHCS